MTPKEIQILISCYKTLKSYSNSQEISELLEYGMIERGEECSASAKMYIYKLTERGAAHILQLCSVPIPIIQYIGYHGELIDDDRKLKESPAAREIRILRQYCRQCDIDAADKEIKSEEGEELNA